MKGVRLLIRQNSSNNCGIQVLMQPMNFSSPNVHVLCVILLFNVPMSNAAFVQISARDTTVWLHVQCFVRWPRT